jgi:hypothetical protein
MIASTDRSRLHRQRRRAGIVPLLIGVKIIRVSEMLIDYGILAEWDADDPHKVATGVERLLDLLDTERAAVSG